MKVNQRMNALQAKIIKMKNSNTTSNVETKAIDKNDDNSKSETVDSSVAIVEIEISKLVDNPFQPRINMNSKEIESLADSIDENGLLQPIPITEEENGVYTIIAGHRRVEAHKVREKKFIKAYIVKDVTRKDLATLALIENLQRENLNIIETAMQYKYLIDSKIYKTQKDLSIAISKDFAEVSKTISILKLSDVVLDKIKRENKIKDLKILDMLRKVDIEKQMELYEWIIKNNPSRIDLKEHLERGSKREDKMDVKDDFEEFNSIKKTQTEKKVVITLDKEKLSSEILTKIDEALKVILRETVDS